jgi:hypothetical protein
MQRIGGFRFVQQGNSKLCMFFTNPSKTPRQVEEWLFKMEATFQVVNGAYPGVVVRAPAHSEFLGNSANTFSATASFDNQPMETSRFREYLYPNRQLLTFLTFPPPVNNRGATSHDTWSMSWRDGETKSTVRYLGQYQ